MYSDKITQYPITPFLNEICQNLKNSPSRYLILTAETAAGKSTVLPLALADNFPGKLIMTEPRRLAVLGVANRLSELKDENPGESVGYKIHLETKISAKTKTEIVTEAVLVRQLQSDEALQEYNVVVIDEFHERSINTDLALAFIKEAMLLRDDLYVVIMSATIDTEKLQSYLSDDKTQVPVMKIPGRQFPVDISYDSKSTVCEAIKKAISTQKNGNILVFLPGIYEIKKIYDELKEKISEDVEINILHSSISLDEQKKVINGTRGTALPVRKVILSSAIAETSLTVPGVTCVIDSGLSRVNRMNVSTGMENLYTETESVFSAEQRAGRAGRICAGTCIRLWSEANPRIKEMPPEILRADLTTLVLECAERGIFKNTGIDWLEKPSEAMWNESTKLLQNLGMLKSDGRISDDGKNALKLGVHPRLAGIALAGFKNGKLTQEAKTLLIKYSSYSKSAEYLQNQFVADLERRLGNLNYHSEINAKTDDILILAGYPDRLAKRLSEVGVEPAEYQFASGRKAKILEGKAPEWIVAPEVLAGEREGKIFEFESSNQQKLAEFAQKNAKTREFCCFLNERLQKFEEICYGEIILSSKKIPVSDGDFAKAWCNEVQKNGLSCLHFNEKIEKFLMKVEFYNQQKNINLDLKVHLQETVEKWFIPFLGNSTKINGQTVFDALYWYLEGSKIDAEVPDILVLPTGRKCKVKYEKLSSPNDKNVLVIRPVIEIIIQRIFGCFNTPVICGMKVLLRLLSPANRPLQITDDLENFWDGAWIEICKEMKGRYPKHKWDYKVVQDD